MHVQRHGDAMVHARHGKPLQDDSTDSTVQ